MKSAPSYSTAETTRRERAETSLRLVFSVVKKKKSSLGCITGAVISLEAVGLAGSAPRRRSKIRISIPSGGYAR